MRTWSVQSMRCLPVILRLAQARAQVPAEILLLAVTFKRSACRTAIQDHLLLKTLPPNYRVV